MMETITIDGKEYEVEHLEDSQKAIVQALNYCSVKIDETKHQLAALETAKQAYINDLGNQLKEDS